MDSESGHGGASRTEREATRVVSARAMHAQTTHTTIKIKPRVQLALGVSRESARTVESLPACPSPECEGALGVSARTVKSLPAAFCVAYQALIKT